MISFIPFIYTGWPNKNSTFFPTLVDFQLSILCTKLGEIPVSRLISIGLLLVPGCSSRLHMKSSMILVFAAVRTITGSAAAGQPTDDTSLVNFRTKSYNVCLFHCLAGNSRIT